MGKFNDITGNKYGRWTVINQAPRKSGQTYWNCICACGTEMPVYAGSLKSGKSVSCGCFNIEGTVARCFNHGHSNGGSGTRTYNCWRNMKARCGNPNNHKWPDYGGRGITYCPEWETFAGFLSDMGECPSKEHSIDRIDNSGNYTKSNCKWSNHYEQANNTRKNTELTHDGRTMTLSEWAKETGIPRSTIMQRISRRGWSVRRALTEMVQFGPRSIGRD